MHAKPPMRLLLISRAHSPAAGGMERLSFELIRELKKIPALEVRTLIRQGGGRIGAIFFILRSLPRALALAREADVVHLGDPVLALHGWLIKKLYRKPVAVTVHGLDVTYGKALYQLYLRLFGKCDLALPISGHARELLQNSPLQTQKSAVITPGVHDRYFDSSITREDLAAFLKRTTNYHPQATDYVLFTAGRLIKRKGHAWFITEVLPKLPPRTVYLIAGDGPERENIKKSAADNVLLLGRVSDADLKILYNTVDAFVQPNIPLPGDAEGFGLVLLEAALCQRPVFASRLDGIPEAIHDGQNGTLLPAEDAAAWAAALQRPAPVNPVARAYTLQHFGWPAQAQKFLQALRTIV